MNFDTPTTLPSPATPPSPLTATPEAIFHLHDITRSIYLRIKSWFMLGACRVKVALHHTYVALCMRSVIWHLHDVCKVHIRRNSVPGRLKLFVVKWLGLGVTVRVRARDRKWISFPFFFFFCSKK